MVLIVINVHQFDGHLFFYPFLQDNTDFHRIIYVGVYHTLVPALVHTLHSLEDGKSLYRLFIV